MAWLILRTLHTSRSKLEWSRNDSFVGFKKNLILLFLWHKCTIFRAKESTLSLTELNRIDARVFAAIIFYFPRHLCCGFEILNVIQVPTPLPRFCQLNFVCISFVLKQTVERNFSHFNLQCADTGISTRSWCVTQSAMRLSIVISVSSESMCFVAAWCMQFRVKSTARGRMQCRFVDLWF